MAFVATLLVFLRLPSSFSQLFLVFLHLFRQPLPATTLGKELPSNNNNAATGGGGPAKDIATAVAEARHAREAREAAQKQGELVAQAAAAAAAEAREQVNAKKEK